MNERKMKMREKERVKGMERGEERRGGEKLQISAGEVRRKEKERRERSRKEREEEKERWRMKTKRKKELLKKKWEIRGWRRAKEKEVEVGLVEILRKFRESLGVGVMLSLLVKHRVERREVAFENRRERGEERRRRS